MLCPIIIEGKIKHVRILFQSFRFNRILISISHIAEQADYNTAIVSSRVE